MSLSEDVRAMIPPLNVIKDERKRQNQIFEIHHILSHIIYLNLAVQANGNKINLRFAADGRRTSNKIGTVMAVLSLLEEESYGCDHLYAIALYNGKEDYEEIKIYLGATFEQVNELQMNALMSSTLLFESTRYCCSDVVLAMVYGINSAAAKYFCVWCYCSKAQIADF
ncbi:unnamed protein product, partial [Pocillopora meandrina]